MPSKYPQKLEVQTPQEIEALLANNLENNDKHHKVTHNLLASNLEHSEKSRNENTSLLENHLELAGKTKDVVEKGAGQIAEAVNGLKPVMDAAGFIQNFMSAIKGDKGEQGEKGEVGQPGDKGEQGLQGEQGIEGREGKPGQSIKGEKGEKGEKGDRGDDGHNADPVDLESVIKEVVKRIPKSKEVKPISVQEVLKEIKGKFSYRDLKDAPDFNPTFPKLAGTGFLREISDVNTQGLKVGQVLEWNGTYWVPVTPSSGGSGNSSMEILSGSGNVWTAQNNPIMIIADNQPFYNGVGVDVTGTGPYTLTFTNAPSTVACLHN